jgi:hypothetical protein
MTKHNKLVVSDEIYNLLRKYVLFVVMSSPSNSAVTSKVAVFDSIKNLVLSKKVFRMTFVSRRAFTVCSSASLPSPAKMFHSLMVQNAKHMYFSSCLFIFFDDLFQHKISRLLRLIGSTHLSMKRQFMFCFCCSVPSVGTQIKMSKTTIRYAG